MILFLISALYRKEPEQMPILNFCGKVLVPSSEVSLIQFEPMLSLCSLQTFMKYQTGQKVKSLGSKRNKQL